MCNDQGWLKINRQTLLIFFAGKTGILKLQGCKKKIKTALQKYKISDFYYIAFISTKDSVYLTALKMNIDNFNKLIVDDDKKIDKSIFIKNFINPSYGNVKLYKSKKRLELRFKKNILDKSTLLYHISS